MMPSVSQLLLEGNASTADSLDFRLKTLTVYKMDSEKPLLEKQAEETRRERVLITNKEAVAKLQNLIDSEVDLVEFQRKAREVLEKEQQHSVNTEEFYRLLIQHSVGRANV